MYSRWILLFMLLWLQIQSVVSSEYDVPYEDLWCIFSPKDCDRIQELYRDIHREKAKWKSLPVWDEFHVNASSLNVSSVLNIYTSLLHESHQVEHDSKFQHMDVFKDLQVQLRRVQTERRKQWLQTLLNQIDVNISSYLSEMKQTYHDLLDKLQAVKQVVQHIPTKEQMVNQKQEFEMHIQKFEHEQTKRNIADMFVVAETGSMFFLLLFANLLVWNIRLRQWIQHIFTICKKKKNIKDDQESDSIPPMWEEEWFHVPDRKQLEPFICPICYNILREPQQASKCGHVFCKTCIQHWRKQSNTCPLDHGYLYARDLFADGRVQREISQLPIRCCFNPQKCKFRHPQVGDGSAWKKHALVCKFRPKSSSRKYTHVISE